MAQLRSNKLVEGSPMIIMAGMGSLAEEVVRTDGSRQSLSFQPPSLAYTSKSEVKISELPELNK
ncbi:hypothetical protein J1N35_021425 [Gossypium stocksii]|uniref:Uncharacterized protein n=1 Tax=Gossypium stocksii TaxID=47602 RepID=A0A9D3VGQ0_9ROSI|nr:hypothetical protein J1N35_021425 [Gossypium stocksii]